MRFFDGCYGLFVVAYRLKPVAVMFLAYLQVKLVRTNHRLDDLRITGIKGFRSVAVGHRITSRGLIVSARNEYPSIGAFKLYPVWQFIADHHLHPVIIQCIGREDTVDVPQARLRKFGVAPNFNRPGTFRAHTPMRRVDVVRPPSSDHSCAELLTS